MSIDHGPTRGGQPVATAEPPLADLLKSTLDSVYRRRDALFAALMIAQWVFGIVIAVLTTPQQWSGAVPSLHLHVKLAIFLGGLLSVPPILLAWRRPGWVVTRHVVAISQMLWSSLLIHLTGGRIETHFHVFGSLAFLAYYRDWKVLATGSAVVLLDHLLRGIWWPESVYGIANPEWWRTLEHGFWVLFEDVVLLMGIQENRREMLALVTQQVALVEMNSTIELKVAERTRELAASHLQYRALLETTGAMPWQLSMPERHFTYVGPQAATLLGGSSDDWLEPGYLTARVHPDDQLKLYRQLREMFAQHGRGEFQFRMRRDDATWIWVRCHAGWGESDGGPCLRGFLQDVTERRTLETELQQSQKLESVGRLAAGIAHEINTPIQYVGDSIHFIRDGIDAMLKLLASFRATREAAGPGGIDAAAVEQMAAAEEEADVTYLEERLPKAIERSVDGLERVATLVRAMKEFAHPDRTEQQPADLNRAIQATLTIATNEYKYVASLETELGELPPIVCHVNELNQVFLNIVVNAAHAIGDVVKGTDQKGVIRVSTHHEDGVAVIEISDTGGGIPEAIQAKVFDPFFTTKEVGKGTGQGLAIARSVVVEKHGGTLTFQTARGRGTTFVIRLPVAGRQEPAAKAA